MEFLHSFLRRHFAGKPVVTSRKCRLFSQAGLFRQLPDVLNIFFGLFVSASRRLPSFIWRCCWWINYRWNLSQTVYPATCVGKCLERFHLPPIRKGNWSRNVSRNCFWDRHCWRADQLLDNILLTGPGVFAWVKSAQFPSRFWSGECTPNWLFWDRVWDWVGVVSNCIMGLFWGANFDPVS